MNIEELENYYNKYDIFELESLKTIMSYVKEDITQEVEVLNKVYKEKWIPYDKEFSVPLKPANYSLLNILKKNKDLNDQELDFLYGIVENASFYLSSIQDYQDEYKNVIEDFDIDEYPVLSMFELETALYNELEDRKSKIYVKK